MAIYAKCTNHAYAKRKLSPCKSLQHSTIITDKIWKSHTIPSLKNILRENNLTVCGNKMVLIDRLLNNNIVITT